jgi:thiol:disulfide interchange protein DsbC
MMLYKLLIISLFLYSTGVLASEPDKPDLSNLQAALGGESPDSVKPTVIPGLYEVVVNSQVLYLSNNGRFAIQGDILDLKARSNITEARRSDLRIQAVDAIGEENMVIFAPDKPAKHTVTVFTDIDCGYCRRFHQQIADYNREGIKVRYLMFPRAGIGSDSYKKAVAVWCADDRKKALTRAKRGEDIELKSCDNPVQKEYEIGKTLGVRGTPSIILENGEMVPGYVPPAQLAQMLDNKN